MSIQSQSQLQKIWQISNAFEPHNSFQKESPNLKSLMLLFFFLKVQLLLISVGTTCQRFYMVSWICGSDARNMDLLWLKVDILSSNLEPLNFFDQKYNWE